MDYEDEEAEEEVEVEEGGRSMEDLRGIVQLVRFLFFFLPMRRDWGLLLWSRCFFIHRIFFGGSLVIDEIQDHETFHTTCCCRPLAL